MQNAPEPVVRRIARALTPAFATRAVRRARARPVEALTAAFAVAVAAYVICAPLGASLYPPMTDLPMHAAQAGILRHYWDPNFHFREQFALQPIAVPYVSMYALAAFAMLFTSPAVAMKLAVAAMLALVPTGLAVLAAGMKKSPLLGLAGLPLCWCTLVHWGFLNFVGALGLFTLVVGFTLLVLDDPTRVRRWGLAVSLVALFFTHIFRFPFGLAAVVGTAVVTLPAKKKTSKLVLPVLPSLTLFAWFWFTRPETLKGGLGELGVHFERADQVRRNLFAGFTDAREVALVDDLLYTYGAFAAACLALRLARAAVASPWPERFEKRAFRVGAAVAVACCAAVFAGLFLVLPMQIGTWWYVYPREATSAVYVSLALLPDLPKGAFVRLACALALAMPALHVARITTENYATFDAPSREFAAIASRVPQAPKLMYLIFDHGGTTRTITPFIHLPAWIQAERGGWLSFHFARFGASPMRYRTDEPGAVVPPPFTVRWEWKPHLFDVNQQGAFFDWFLVRAVAPPDHLFAADPSVRRVANEGRWWLYARRPGPRP